MKERAGILPKNAAPAHEPAECRNILLRKPGEDQVPDNRESMIKER